MRGLFVVNPRATTTSDRVSDVIVSALSHDLDLEVVTTAYRGHARELGESARHQGLDVVITLGGDGVINEVINGMLIGGTGPEVPILATVPGGSGNVLVRALGLPLDPVEATGHILDALRGGTARPIGLGRANGRWFATNAGVGLDAEIIAAMEEQRARGEIASPLRYLRTTLRQYFERTDRKHPALTIEVPGGEPIQGVFMTIVQNTAPWTYLGPLPIDPCPQASFDCGLDYFALRSLGVGAALRAARRMLARSRAGSTDTIALGHDLAAFSISASRPMPFQADGESVAEVTHVDFEAVPMALRVITGG